MFSQKPESSLDGTCRKLGSMLISLCSHMLVLAVLVGLPLLFSEVVLVEAHGSLVSTLTFTPRPGGLHQLEQQPNTMHIPQAATVRIDPNAASKIHVEQLKPVEAMDSLLVLAPLAQIPKLDKGWPGRCGCVNPYRPVRPTPSPRPPFLGQPSWLHQAVLLRKVDPEYPTFAKRAGVHGAVVIHATIDRAGAVSDISVVSGPQQLREAAVDAVRQWRYQPYILNGIAIEVETTITVNFLLPDASDQNQSRTL